MNLVNLIDDMPLNVNAHLHTPYSFSAFEQLTEALDMAKKEEVSVVGINDFYSLDGYAEWDAGCKKRKLYPLFNIEFISLQSDDQAAGLRVNDPGNPGRTYLSGKGLAFPVILSGKPAEELAAIRNESNVHAERMCGKLNELLAKINACFALDFACIEKECVACGVCVKGCPLRTLTVHRGLNAVVDENRCVGCAKCAGICPAGVITIKEAAEHEEALV